MTPPLEYVSPFGILLHESRYVEILNLRPNLHFELDYSFPLGGQKHSDYPQENLQPRSVRHAQAEPSHRNRIVAMGDWHPFDSSD